MPKACFVNVAVGSRRYTIGAERLKKSLEAMGHDCFFFHNDVPVNSPRHNVVPYAFKPYAVMDAIRNSPHDIIVWIDACIYPQHSLDEFLRTIEREGYFFMEDSGWTMGEWCGDYAIQAMDLKREEWMNKPSMASGIIGLHRKFLPAMAFAAQWLKLAEINGPFHGPRTNYNREASIDPRVRGHRQDQTVGTVIIDRLGLKMTPMPEVLTFNLADKKTLFVSDGNL